MERIDLADFLLIAEFHTGINAHQLARIDRVVQLAESALAAPFAGYGDFEAYPTFADKAGDSAYRVREPRAVAVARQRTP